METRDLADEQGGALRGIHHVGLPVLNYEESIQFYDKTFGRLGYKNFWTHNIGYLPTY